MQSNTKTNTQVTHRLINDTTLGFTVLGYDELTLDLTKVHADNRAWAEIHGWCQRVPDKAAVNRDDKKSGAVRTAKEILALKYEGIKAVIEHYQSGSPEWAMKGAGGARGAGFDGTLVIEAVAGARGVTFAAIQDYVGQTAKSMNVSRQAVLDVLAEQYADQIAELRRERTADVDKTAMLAGLPIKE